MLVAMLEMERSSLAVGAMLAEGGEGRVHELADHRETLFKAYRSPVAAGPLRALVEWPAALAAVQPDLATRVKAASAWPSALVLEGSSGRAAGLLMPRAPRRFWVRHRDGGLRLSSLSYLTADPRQRAAAYGLELPAPMAAERLGLAYALARLIEAFEGCVPCVAHGDLSARNVLWSLERGPEVFVIDCDNAEIFGPDGLPAAADGRRRAMTPNWDDPAVARGTNPTLASDRYSLALIFLRIVGAANFPIQARQRGGGPVSVDFPVPAGGPASRL
ncbi:MAG TPA: phosphotransferase, partial [Acidimicrobiales bacterium]|nr:phosphotransferase [Acidimicrobiales bacterium]